MFSRGNSLHRRTTDIATGLELNRGRQCVAIIEPYATENKYTNPSFERNTTGWIEVKDGAAGAALARSSDCSFRGAWCAKVQVNPSGTYVQLTSGSATLAVTTTISFHVRRTGNKPVNSTCVKAVHSAGVYEFGKIEYISAGWWRCILTCTPTATQPVGIRVYGKGSEFFYIDACQWENLSFETTYCDGDEIGLLPNELPASYLWDNEPHGSVSYRTENTRSGGRVWWYDDFGFTVNGVVGLGIEPQETVTTDSGTGEGAFYQVTTNPPRDISIVGRFDGTTQIHCAQQRSDLYSLQYPQVGGIKQPLVLLVQHFRDEYAISARGRIIAVYVSGLEQNLENTFSEAVSIKYSAIIPFIIDEADQAIVDTDSAASLGLGYIAVFENEKFLRVNDDLDSYTGDNRINGMSNCIVLGPDGKFYVGGNFSNPVSKVGVYDPVTNTWSALGAGLTQQVNCLAFDRYNGLYAGLDAGETIGADTCTLVRWDGVSWTCVNNGYVRPIDNIVYNPYNYYPYVISGRYFDYWDGISFNNIHTHVVGEAFSDMYFDLERNKFYLCGYWLDTTGTGSVHKVAYTVAGSWELLGENGDPSEIGLHAIISDARGRVFTANDATHNVYMWNGSTWAIVPITDDTSAAPVVNGAVLSYDKFRDKIWFCGASQLDNFLNGKALFSIKDNTMRLMGDVTFFGHYSRPVVSGPKYTVVGSYNRTQNLYTTNAGTMHYRGTAKAYLKLQISGLSDLGARTMGVRQVKNFTINKAVLFKDKNMSDNETVDINLEPGRVSYNSSIFGSFSETNIFIYGSDVSELCVVPGDNYLALEKSGEAVIVAFITRPKYQALDDLVGI